MRTIVWFAIACVAASATTATAASATPVKPDAAGARSYVQTLYNRYEHEKDFGVFGEKESQFFDASTSALLAQDNKLLAGDVGDIDADYLCVCQDDDGMRATIDTVDMAGANAARAQVTVRYPSQGPKATAHVTIDLAFEGGHWRIHDIDAKDGDGNHWGSVRDVLIKEIRTLSAHH